MDTTAIPNRSVTSETLCTYLNDLLIRQESPCKDPQSVSQQENGLRQRGQESPVANEVKVRGHGSSVNRFIINPF